MNDHTYTAEDFKNARFASHYAGGTSRRKLDGMWDSGPSGRRRTDDEMAADGWRPVHEHNPHATDALEEWNQDLRDENAHLKVRLEKLHDELALWHERASQADAYARKADPAPLTLDTLREAWETAESLEAYRSIISEGDVLIIKEPHGIYLVRPAYEEVLVGRTYAENVRVLHRAPQPEPWQALADMLGGHAGYLISDRYTTADVARALYAEGVRVVGGDNDE